MKRRVITRGFRAGTGRRSGTTKGSCGRSRLSLRCSSNAASPRLRSRRNRTSQSRFRMKARGSSVVDIDAILKSGTVPALQVVNAQTDPTANTKE